MLFTALFILFENIFLSTDKNAPSQIASRSPYPGNLGKVLVLLSISPHGDMFEHLQMQDIIYKGF